jgi:hypothetical protein
METKIKDLENDYGYLHVKKDKKKYYIGITSVVWHTKWKEISLELYNMLIELNKQQVIIFDKMNKNEKK